MKMTLGILAAAGLTAAGVLSTRSPEPSPVAAAFDGCLRNGSAPSVFILRGARQTGAEGGARDYLLVGIASGVDPGGALNHTVTIEGDAAAAGEGPEPPGAANSAEKALRRLTVRALRDSGQRC
jgi:hypothetical protein